MPHTFIGCAGYSQHVPDHRDTVDNSAPQTTSSCYVPSVPNLLHASLCSSMGRRSSRSMPGPLQPFLATSCLSRARRNGTHPPSMCPACLTSLSRSRCVSRAMRGVLARGDVVIVVGRSRRDLRAICSTHGQGMFLWVATFYAWH